jgi:hypothetical protein
MEINWKYSNQVQSIDEKPQGMEDTLYHIYGICLHCTYHHKARSNSVGENQSISNWFWITSISRALMEY